MLTIKEEKNEVKKYVSGRLSRLTKGLESGSTKASLAQLRRGIGKKPGELPELWGAFLKDLPEELMLKTDVPSRAEWAVYTALTLFALHQQGHSEPMNEQGEKHRLGRAVRKLVPDSGEDSNEEESDEEDSNEKSVKLKLSLAANSDDMTELAYRLRTLVSLLSSESIKLDYVDLAGDLFLFQYENQADYVRLKWGQDFYRIEKTDDNGKEYNNEEK